MACKTALRLPRNTPNEKLLQLGISNTFSEFAEALLGASAGIGESTALHFASLGCALSLMARKKAPLDNVAKACCENGLPNDKVLVVPGDISVDEDAAAVVEKTVRHFGKLDILVNNAALRVEGYTDTATLEQFDRAWNVNLRGTLCMIRNAIPHLRQSKGTIINISSASSSTVDGVKHYIPLDIHDTSIIHPLPTNMHLDHKGSATRQ
ncbi:uncharacterized protein [Dermacentor albipictus]|uniref:uncharacterized protein n=1 Tax=Dermacentor albipictus TaxID=60249 RepID=UPI0038FD3077